MASSASTEMLDDRSLSTVSMRRTGDRVFEPSFGEAEDLAGLSRELDSVAQGEYRIAFPQPAGGEWHRRDPVTQSESQDSSSINERVCYHPPEDRFEQSSTVVLCEFCRMRHRSTRGVLGGAHESSSERLPPPPPHLQAAFERLWAQREDSGAQTRREDGAEGGVASEGSIQERDCINPRLWEESSFDSPQNRWYRDNRSSPSLMSLGNIPRCPWCFEPLDGEANDVGGDGLSWASGRTVSRSHTHHIRTLESLPDVRGSDNDACDELLQDAGAVLRAEPDTVE